MRIVNLLGRGLVDYREVDALQRSLHARVLQGGEDAVVVSQFTPTWTAGRHTKPQDIPDSDVPVIRVDRAGSATWHGPGQLVVYPVVRLREPVDLVAWIRSVERGVIDTVRAQWHLPARRVEGRAGVWITEEGRRDRKLTLHGLALNVAIDPQRAFTGIIPCGLADADVASLSWEGVHTTVEAACAALVPALIDAIAPQLARPVSDVSTTDPRTLQ